MWGTYPLKKKSLGQGTVSGRQLDTVIAWVVVVVTVAAAGRVAAQDTIPLLQGYASCVHNQSSFTLTCDVTGEDKVSVLHSSTWKNINKTIVIGAKSLNIKPQCNARGKLVKIIGSQKVKTLPGNESCVVHLHLTNSSATAITSVASLLRIKNSEVDLIKRDPVEQFDIYSSTVADLSVRATDALCEIIDSTVKILRRVILDGNFTFKINTSYIGNLKHLNYNSSEENSKIVNVTVDKVESEGLVVSKGTLTLQQVTIHSLPARAIILQGGATLRVEDCHIANAEVDSVVVESGTVEFHRVTIGNNLNVSFTLKDAGGGLRLFALVFGPSSIAKWIVAGICIGLVIGILIGGALGFYFLNRRNKRSNDQDGMELLQTDSPSGASPKTSQGPTITQSQRPAAHQEKIGIDDDECYTDVGNNENNDNSKNNVLNNSYSLPPTNKPPPTVPSSGTPSTTAYPPPPTSYPPPATAYPPPPKAYPPPPTAYPLPTTTNPPPATSPSNGPNMSSNPLVPARVRPPPPVRTDSAMNTSSSFSEERGALPQQQGTLEDDQDFYDELEESQQMPRPPVASNKPSFLHTPLKPSQSVRTTSPNSNPPASSGPTAGPKTVGGRQWPPPKPQLPSKPPPSDTKPSGSTFSADDDEEPIYETIEEP
ncbi:uncharacterized protein [Procambarus clarkii]|uniref:uncharacterized protein isoform X1 n=1 Tax=Procambarus clarkii TaxID=6728 RepID=UPI00374477F0